MIHRMPLLQSAKTTKTAWSDFQGLLVHEANHLLIKVVNEGSASAVFRVMGRLGDGQHAYNCPLKLVFEEVTVAAGAEHEFTLKGEQIKYDEYVVQYKSGSGVTTVKAYGTVKALANVNYPLPRDVTSVNGAESTNTITSTVTTGDGEDAVLHFVLLDPTTFAPLDAGSYTIADGGTGALVVPASASNYVVMKTSGGIAQVITTTTAVGAVLVAVKDGYKGPIINTFTQTFA